MLLEEEEIKTNRLGERRGFRQAGPRGELHVVEGLFLIFVRFSSSSGKKEAVGSSP